MAIDSKNRPAKTLPSIAPPAQAAPTVFREGKPTTAAPAEHLKASTARKLTPEHDQKFQAMMAGVVGNDDALPPEEAALRQYQRFMLLTENCRDMLDELREEGSGFDPSDPIDQAHAAFKAENPKDRETVAQYEVENLAPSYYNPRLPYTMGRGTHSPHSVMDDGFRPPTYKLDKNAARTDLARDIATVSKMYAGDAGMSEKDFAKVMGGIATIESRFGVSRSVTGTKHPSSAGGAFHYLDGTIAGEVRNAANDPRITSRVAALGVNTKDGIAKSEAWTLKDDNILAGSVLARHIVDTVKKHPELRNDPAALATRVYQTHNMGEAGANALARGGLTALNAVDSRIAENNPMFFNGAGSSAEVNQRYTKFVAGAVNSASPLIEAAFSVAPPPLTTAHTPPAPDRRPQPA